MAQKKLWFRHIVFRSLMGLLVTVSFSSQADDRLIGFTLLFQSMGREVVVQRVDLDGKRGPVPGAVGGIYPQGGAEMTFMPGDREQGIPQFVEVAWVVPTDDFNRWAKDEGKKLKGMLDRNQLAARRVEFKRRWAANPQYIKRVDLTQMLTPGLIEQVCTNRLKTQLRLIITFNNDDVDILARAYKR